MDSKSFCKGLQDYEFVHFGCIDDLLAKRMGGVTIKRDDDQPSISGIWFSCDGLNPQDVANFTRLMFGRKGDNNVVEYGTWPTCWNVKMLMVTVWRRYQRGKCFEKYSASMERLYLNLALKSFVFPNFEH